MSLRPVSMLALIVLFFATAIGRAEDPRPGGIDLVRRGEALAVREVGTPWKQEAGMLVGSGIGNSIVSDYTLGAGDFTIGARLSLDAFGTTAAAIELGVGSRFGFDGGEGARFFVEGPHFGGEVRTLGRADEHILPGTPFGLEIERRRGKVTFRVNGNEVHTENVRGPLDRIAVRPHRGTVRILALRLDGNLRRAERPRPPGYSIPVIDLAGESDRQVIVDREPGVYLGHPTTVLLEDGRTIICVYPRGHGRGPIIMKRSADGGITWSERLPTPENWSTSKETPTIHRVIDRDGSKRLILFSGLHPVRLASSEDDGRSWTPLEPVGEWGGIVAMGAVARRVDGSYAAWFHDDGRFLRPEKGPSRFDVFQTVSEDGGRTWSEPRSIAYRPDVHLCEPGFVRSPDGGTIALLLRENSRTRNSFVIFSEDEGETWSDPVELPGALTGDRHTAVYVPDGRLFISFRDTTRESSTQGDWVGWVGTWEDIVQGREGQYRVRLMDNHVRGDCAYPGVLLLPDGTVVTTTYGHWTEEESPYIVTVRLRLEELDARLAR